VSARNVCEISSNQSATLTSRMTATPTYVAPFRRRWRSSTSWTERPRRKRTIPVAVSATATIAALATRWARFASTHSGTR